VTSTADVECSGRTSTCKTDETVDEVKELVLQNRRITTRYEVADMLGILFASHESSLKDKRSEKWNSCDWFLHHYNATANCFTCA
jgi:hypothetical protein